jgi:hypothetical protein
MRLEQFIRHCIGRRDCGRDACHYGNDIHGAGNARDDDYHGRHAGNDYNEYHCHGAGNARGHDYHGCHAGKTRNHHDGCDDHARDDDYRCRHAGKTRNHHDGCDDHGAGKTCDDCNTNRPDTGRGNERSRRPAHRDQ